jgi:hypothetical protein
VVLGPGKFSGSRGNAGKRIAKDTTRIARRSGRETKTRNRGQTYGAYPTQGRLTAGGSPVDSMLALYTYPSTGLTKEHYLEVKIHRRRLVRKPTRR